MPYEAPQIDPLKIDMQGAMSLGLQMRQLNQTQQLRDIQEGRLDVQEERLAEQTRAHGATERMKQLKEQADTLGAGVREGLIGPMQAIPAYNKILKQVYGNNVQLTGADVDSVPVLGELNQLMNDPKNIDNPLVEQKINQITQPALRKDLEQRWKQHQVQAGREQLAKSSGLNYTPSQQAAIGSDPKLGAHFADQTAIAGRLQYLDDERVRLDKEDTVNQSSTKALAEYKESGEQALQDAAKYVKTLHRLEPIRDEKIRAQTERLQPGFQDYKDQLKQKVAGVDTQVSDLSTKLSTTKKQMLEYLSGANSSEASVEYKAMLKQRDTLQVSLDMKRSETDYYNDPTARNYQVLKSKQQVVDRLVTDNLQNAKVMKQKMLENQRQKQALQASQFGGMSNFTNVQQDGSGGFIGLNKTTGRMEQVPVAEGIRAGGQLTQDARSAAAQRYLVDGTLPPNLGRGAQGAANTTAVLNEAAVLAAASGQTGEAQRITQLANKASASALSQLSAQEAKLASFEGTFRKNLDLAQRLSAKVDRATGVPIVNAWIQAGQRSVTGNADITALDVAVKSVVNEFARITTSASGSGQNTAEGEIKKIEGLLKAAQTPEQFNGVLDTMRKETQNRMDAFHEQKAKIRASMGGAGRRASDRTGLPETSDIDAELARRGVK